MIERRLVEVRVGSYRGPKVISLHPKIERIRAERRRTARSNLIVGLMLGFVAGLVTGAVAWG